MTDGFDYAGFVARHQAERADRFIAPAWDEFADSFGLPVPAALRSLYQLGVSLSLMKAPIRLGDIEIQGFIPLSSHAIAAGQRYAWKFFEFAVGSSGESLLYSLDGSDLIFVDYRGDGSDIESTETLFTPLLLPLSQHIRTTG